MTAAAPASTGPVTAPTVRATSDPAEVLVWAGGFLAGDPVRHNLILTLLHNRVRQAAAGRYWVVENLGEAAGVVLQSPLDFHATVTPMGSAAVQAVVDAVVASGTRLPGVNGRAATAARFAGHWAERTGAPVRPVEGQRLYEAAGAQLARAVPGRLRPASEGDTAIVVEWFVAFGAETNQGGPDAARRAATRVADGEVWLWDAGGPAAMAGLSQPVAGAVRIGPVYTPPEGRNHGFASALVAGLTAAALAQSWRCLLYTDLANPTSNAIYRAIGYRVVEEVLRYDFEQGRS